MGRLEALWEDLSRNADALESPAWHREVLEARERRVASGTSRFSDGDRATADSQAGRLSIEVLAP